MLSTSPSGFQVIISIHQVAPRREVRHHGDLVLAKVAEVILSVTLCRPTTRRTRQCSQHQSLCFLMRKKRGDLGTEKKDLKTRTNLISHRSFQRRKKKRNGREGDRGAERKRIRRIKQKKKTNPEARNRTGVQSEIKVKGGRSQVAKQKRKERRRNQGLTITITFWHRVKAPSVIWQNRSF